MDRKKLADIVRNCTTYLLILSFCCVCPVSAPNLSNLKNWCSKEVTLSTLSWNRNENMSSGTFQRKARVEVIIPSSSWRLVFVPSECLFKFITPGMRTVQDCYILELDSSKQELIPLATFSNPGEFALERWHIDVSSSCYSMRAFVQPHDHF